MPLAIGLSLASPAAAQRDETADRAEIHALLIACEDDLAREQGRGKFRRLKVIPLMPVRASAE